MYTRSRIMPVVPAAEASDELVGRVVGERYRVLRKLGEGGMGSVYLAEHEVIGRRVALKVLAAELSRDPVAVGRFVQEGRALSRIRHRHIVDVFDFEVSDAISFIAMEYLEGEDLYQTVQREGPLPPARVRALVRQVAQALSAAHAAGVVHRDLKPENIRRVTHDGEGDLIKLVDFGVAKLLDGEGSRARLTRAGTIIGTPEYMSPEQITGRPLDHRSDIYSLGCIVFELLSGRPPFTAPRPMDLMGQHLFAPLPPLRAPTGEVPPDLERLCRRALEKDPASRFQTAEALAQALGEEAPIGGSEAGTTDPRASGSVVPRGAGPEPAGAAERAAEPTSRTSLDGQGEALAGGPRSTLPWRGAAASVAALAGIAVAGWALTSRPAWLRGPAPAAERGAALAGRGPAPPPERRVLTGRGPAPPSRAGGASGEAPVAAPASEPPPFLAERASARVIVTGTTGADVMLNTRQRLGKVPLDIELPLLLGARREAGELLVRRRGCVPLIVDVVLLPGGLTEAAAELRCSGAAPTAAAPTAHIQARATLTAAGRPRPPEPKYRTELRNPFGP